MTDAIAGPDLYQRLMAVKPEHLTKNKWLVAAGVNRSFFTDLRDRGRARSDIIDKLLAVAKVTREDLDRALDGQDEPGLRAARANSSRDNMPFFGHPEDSGRNVPLLGTALGADFEVSDAGAHEFAEVTDLDIGEVVDHIRRPATLRGRDKIYALTVAGSSMEPKYEAGDPIYVDPKGTPRNGDDIVLYLRRGEGSDEAESERLFSVLIKRLVRRSATFIELEQFSPALTFKLEARQVAKLHRVVPWREIVF
jgi:phage repressor protein C with HTH and peptisase S24 domain